MCGIIGYVGEKQAYPVLLDGLKRLEYRGYDAAGVAVFSQEGLKVCKTEGAIEELAEECDVGGTVGMGHTRWATHGSPQDKNAHPHLDCTETIAIVHNGIIENFIALKEELVSKDHQFTSETDSEIVAHLIEEYYTGDMHQALSKAVERLHGSYAIAALHAEHPGTLYAARRDSSLVVGRGEGEMYLASDIPAILGYTREVYIMEDGEIAVLSSDSAAFYDGDAKRLDKTSRHIDWGVEAAEKGGYDHYMLKEIFEQPQAIRNTIAGGMPFSVDVEGLERIYVVAMGTARHAGLVGRELIERLARIPVHVELGSEFRYRDPLVDAHCLTVVLSQSGETADTLAGLREAKERGSLTLAITNVEDSSIAREADLRMYTRAGPEIAVASTKAYSTQLVALTLLAVHLAKQKGLPPIPAMEDELHQLPVMLEHALEDLRDPMKQLAHRLHQHENMFFIGRGVDYAVVEEGALKLKEISYVHAQAYAAGELKHGTLALVEEGVPIVALATAERTMDKMISSIEEVKARGAFVVTVSNGQRTLWEQISDEVVVLPTLPELLSPVMSVVPLQLFAYYMALERGCNIDKPRNLAKSVTVE